VAVGDHVAGRKLGEKPLLPSGRRSRVVHETDSETLQLEDGTFGKRRAELGLVHVPVDASDWCERAELLEEGCGGEVAHVQDRVGLCEEATAALRKPAGTAREVRIADERDQRNSGRKAPSR
jgi:hypothetical protein